RLFVHERDDRGGEVEDLLELLGSDVEEVPDPARDALEEPDVRDRRREVDVPHPLTADLGARHLDAAALTDDALVADALVLAAVALPVLGRTEDALAEQTVLLGLERPVVDRLRLGDLARRPAADLLRRRESDPDRVELIDVDQSALLSPEMAVVVVMTRRLPRRRLRRRAAVPPRAPRRGRRAPRRRAAPARRPGRRAPGPPRPPPRWARAPPPSASRATGRSRAP